MTRLPLNDEILIAISRMVDDSQVEKREPSHSQIEDQFRRSGLLGADPHQKDQKPIGKAKRVREVLSWAIENNLEAGEKLVYFLLTLVKGLGGFRDTCPNFIGKETITNLQSVFKDQGYTLSIDGTISQVILEDLSGIEAITALQSYALRAKKGVEDAALLSGTSKDLMEAVAKYIIQAKRGFYPTQGDFPTLLGQAFMELGLATSFSNKTPNEPIQCRVERAIFELACSINSLRNKQGTGHGRPNLSTIKPEEGILVIESIGIISEFMLSKI